MNINKRTTGRFFPIDSALIYVPILLTCALTAVCLLSCSPERDPEFWSGNPSPVELIPAEERSVYDKILVGARAEVNNKTRYDASYQVISYPGGDVQQGRGACTDVVIRALRNAGYDLQILIHEDMKENFFVYPQIWGLSGPDPNIDHRRTQNQMVFLERFGESLTLEVNEAALSEWRHGDLVFWLFPDGQQHTGVISDRVNEQGRPLVIHNGSLAREEDCLLRWEIIGHYRFPPESPAGEAEPSM